MKRNLAFLRPLAALWVLLLVTSCSQSDATLAKRARETEKIAEFQSCCAKIKDQTLVGDLVLTLEPWGRRRTALDYVTNPTILAKLAVESKDDTIQYFANKRLKALQEGRSLSEVETINWYHISMEGAVVEVQNAPSTTWKNGLSGVAVKKQSK